MADDLLNGFDEELGGRGSQKRDWKGIATALFVIVMICLLIGIALVLFTPLTEPSHVFGKRMNLTELRNLLYPYSDFSFSNKSNKIVLMQSWEGVEIVEDGARHVIFARENGNSILPTSDLKYFMTMKNAPNPGRNPANESFFVKIVNDHSRITHDIGTSKDSVLQAFLWNGDNNDFVFVENNQIYYQKSPESNLIIRVSNGKDDLINGIFDWLYKEEIFGRKEAMWWSDRGSQLAFASYDHRMTKKVILESFRSKTLYPITTSLHYPKTLSKALPVYSVFIWDKSSEVLKEMDVQLKDSLSYHYLYTVKWLPINGIEKLITVWTNRLQNEVTITICEFETSICHVEYEYKYEKGRWAQFDDFNKMISYNNSLFFLLPRNIKDNAFQQIVRLPILNGDPKTPEFLPLESFEVSSIEGINREDNKIYFHAAAPRPQRRNLYSLGLLDNHLDCVTCFIKNCSFSQSIISDDYLKAIVSCKGPKAPHTVLLDLFRTEEMQYAQYNNLLDETSYQRRVEEAGLPVIINEKVKINEEFEALIKLSVPREMYTKEKMKLIPLLVEVYGGPNDQNTKEQTRMGMEEYISTNQQIAILRIDGRGSGGRGWKYRSAIYGQLGTVEVEDQITVIRQVLKNYKFLDPSRLAVFGWSYGGFMALSMVEKAEKSFFKCAVSVAPVTNFAYYDAAYTERYMGNTPLELYSDVTKNVENFKNTRLLLMHGLLDDNVHFQNSALLIEELQSKGIDFDLMIYPNQAHSISTKTNHVTGKTFNFLKSCFDA